MYFVFWITNAKAHTRNMQFLLFIQGSSGYVNAPRRYVICNLPVLFVRLPSSWC